MQDIFTRLDEIRRPQLLIQAAREGGHSYRRDAHLRRLMGPGPLPGIGEAIMRLIEMEERYDTERRENEGCYSLVAHVDILIALMAEARLAREAHATRMQTGG